MFFHTEAWALPIGPQAKACGLLDNARYMHLPVIHSMHAAATTSSCFEPESPGSP